MKGVALKRKTGLDYGRAGPPMTFTYESDTNGIT